MSRNKSDLLTGVTKQFEKTRFVAPNTLQINYSDGSVAYRLHDTDVIIEQDNIITLNSGGWRTPTTKDRINSFAPVNIWQENSIWYLNGFMFYDGIQVNSKGEIISEKRPNPIKEVKEAKKRIAKFVNLVTKENLPTPSNGDCWLCLMTTEGKTLGDSTGDHSHLDSHIEEGYIHGSLLVNAMREAGYQDKQIGFHYSGGYVDTFKRSLRKYLQKRLLPVN